MNNPANETRDFTHAEIEAKMRSAGFPEMRWLWARFTGSGVALPDIDEAALGRSRDRHMGAVISHPVIMFLVSIGVALGMYGYLEGLVTPVGPTTVTDGAMLALLAALTTYLFWFIVTLIHRTSIHSWKTISANDLASMLKRRSYMQ